MLVHVSGMVVQLRSTRVAWRRGEIEYVLHTHLMASRRRKTGKIAMHKVTPQAHPTHANLPLNLLTIHSPTRSSTRWPGKDAINILIRNIYSLYLLLFTKTCSEKFNCSCRFFSRTVRSNMVDSPPTYTSEHEYITLEAANNLSYFTRSLPPVPRNCPTPMGVAGKGAHDWFKCHRVIFLSRVAGLYFDFE